MTQPQQSAQQPVQGNTATVVATAAIALALIAVEAQTRQQVQDDISDAMATFIALLIVALATPALAITTGTELLSVAFVHEGLTTALSTAKTKVTTTVRTGYAAGAQVAQAKVSAELTTHGYTAPDALPELGTIEDALVQDIDTMFGHAQTDIQNSVRTAYDSTTGDDRRALAVKKAADAAETTLQNRAAASAGTAVQRGAADAQQALYNDYQVSTGVGGLMKRWRVTSTNPCGMCQALDGTLVGVNAEFDHNATTVAQDLRPVWRNLLAPPRHPNCRCQLELVRT